MVNVLEKYKKMPASARASFWFLICAFLQRGISFITTPIFTRLLNTSEYGKYNTFNSWLSILTVIFTLNLYSGVCSSGIVKFSEDRKKFLSSLEGLTVTFLLFWLVIYLLFHQIWNEIIGLNTIQVLLMIMLMWTTAIFSFWSMEQRVELNYRKLVCITAFVSISKPALSILLVVCANDRVSARIAGIAIVEFVAYIGMFIEHMWKGRSFYSKYYWNYAVKFNLPLVPHYLSMSLLGGADRIMISKMVSESAAGIYGLAYSISQVMVVFNFAMMQTIEPWLYKKIKANEIDQISKVAYPAFFIVAAINLLLIAFAPEVLLILAPRAYYDAVWVIPPVAMSIFFTFSYTFFAVFEFYFAKTKQIAIATTSGAALNILLNYIFINIFGYRAAGYTTLFCYIIYALFHYYFMHQVCINYLDNSRPYEFKVYLGIAISFMAIGFIFMASYKCLIIRYIIILIGLLLLIINRSVIFFYVQRLLSIRPKNNK